MLTSLFSFAAPSLVICPSTRQNWKLGKINRTGNCLQYLKKLTTYWLNVFLILNFSLKLSKISLPMFHGKCSGRPFTVSGQKSTEQRSCHLFSLKFETLLYSRFRVYDKLQEENKFALIDIAQSRWQKRFLRDFVLANCKMKPISLFGEVVQGPIW